MDEHVGGREHEDSEISGYRWRRLYLVRVYDNFATGKELRYFNVFGPRQDPASEYASVIPRFLTALNVFSATILPLDFGKD